MLAALPIPALAIAAAIHSSPSVPQNTEGPRIVGVQSPAPDPDLPELGFDHVNYGLRILPASAGWVAVPSSDLTAAGSFGLGTLVSPDNTIDILAWEDPQVDLESYTEGLEAELELAIGLDMALAKSASVEGWCLEAIDSYFIPGDPDLGDDMVMAYRAARRGAFLYIFTMVGYSGAEATAEQFQYALRNIEILATDPIGSSELPIPDDAIGNHWIRSSGIFEDHLTGVRVVASPDWRIMSSVELRDRFYDSALGLTNADETFWASYTVMPLPQLLDPKDPQSVRDWADLSMNGFLSAETEPTEFTVLGKPLIAHHYEREEEEGYIRQIARAGFENSGIGVVLDFGYDGELEAADIARLLRESVEGFTSMDAARCKEVAAEIQASAASGWIDDNRTLRGGTYRDFRRSMSWTPPTSRWQLAGPGKAERFGRSIRAFASELETGEQFLVHAFRSRSKDMERAWERFVARELGSFTDELFPAPKEAKIGTRDGWIAEVPEPTGGTVATLAMVLHDGVRYECILWGPNDPEATPAVEAVFEGLVIPEGPETRAEFVDGAYTDRLLGFRMRAPSPEWTYEPVKMSRRNAANKGACIFIGPKAERVMVTAIYIDPEDDEATPEILRASYLANLMGATEGMTSRQSATILGQRAIVITGELEGYPYQHAVFGRGNMLYQLSSGSDKGTPLPMATIESLLEFLP